MQSEQRSPAQSPQAAAPAEGELFVPYSLLPAQGSAALAVRLRAVEGLHGSTASRLSLAFRFGPPGPTGLAMDKGKEVSVKYQMDLVKESTGTWFPELAQRGGACRVLLPAQLLAQATRGVVCQLKVTTPGFVTPNVLAVSAALPVPLEPGPVPLAPAKGSRGLAAPIATATLSVSRLFTPEAQATMVRSLVQSLLQHLKQPSTEAASRGGSQGGAGIPPSLEALRPSRGWLPAANVAKELATADGQGRSALRVAVDGRHWQCVQPLVEVACDLRALSEDFRSPLTAALEQGESAEAILNHDTSLGAESKRVALQLSAMLRESRAAPSQGQVGGSAVASRWEALAEEVAEQFRPPPAGQCPAWSGDVFILALEHCPTGKARRKLLCPEGTCAALWRVSLCNNLPGLARKLAVWIGLSVNTSGSVADSPTAQSRRRLLDVQLDVGVEDAMLARALERGMQDERWVKVARVMVHLGAAVTAVNASGRSLLLVALDQADQGHGGFRELLASLLLKLGDEVDHWERPTVLIEENTAECPICMEVLWTSTPTAFVSFAAMAGQSGEGNPHLICAHYFCFDCASQQYMKQMQRQNSDAEFQCPICRAAAREVMPLPDIQVNPRLWFQFLDTNCNGRIDKNTVIQTLEAMLPIDTEHLREALEQSIWAQWDKAGDNVISEREFFGTGGLLEWVRCHQHELQAAKLRGAAPPLSEAEAWFRHWDQARRGRLGRGELMRALCEEACISSLEPKLVQRLKEGIQAFMERHSVDDALPRDRLLRAEVIEDLANVVKEAKSGGGPPPPADAGLAGLGGTAPSGAGGATEEL